MALPATMARLRLPVVCSPMFLVSGPALVVAQCTAGLVGSFPALNARSLSQLDEWLAEIEEALAAWDRDNPDSPAAPFAVNQVLHHSNKRAEEDLALCTSRCTPILITSLGAREDINRSVQSYGGITLHDVTDDRFARKAIEKGASGLIAVAYGAGGHAGRQSPFALIQEIRRWYDGPLGLAGAINSGRAVLAAQALGADFAYVGSAFIAAAESLASDRYRQAVVEAGAGDIVYTSYFTGMHGAYLRGSIGAAGLDPDALTGTMTPEDFRSKGGSTAKIWRDIWAAGQGVGLTERVEPCAAIVDRFAAGYAEARAALTG